jgi:two-component system nitrate/nitrite response regulator NarL
MHRATVVIADRHPMMLQGLASVLGSESEFEIVAACVDAASCIDAISTLSPDIAIIDSAMPQLTALMNHPLDPSNSRSTRFVIFATSEDYDLVSAAAPAGYSVLLKEMTSQAVVQGLREVAKGLTVASLAPADQAVPREQSLNPEGALTMLTERERQIMFLVSQGLPNKEIGRRLNIADGTTKVHLHRIFQKLEINNRTELAALAISEDERANTAQDKPPYAVSDPVEEEH